MRDMERTRADIRPAELAAQLRVALWRAARRMRHVSDVELTPTLARRASHGRAHGPVTAGQLAAFEHVQKPTITRTIRELVERGLIERLPDPLDGRVTWLQTTPEGTALLHAGAPAHRRLPDAAPARRSTPRSARRCARRRRSSRSFAQGDDG